VFCDSIGFRFIFSTDKFFDPSRFPEISVLRLMRIKKKGQLDILIQMEIIYGLIEAIFRDIAGMPQILARKKMAHIVTGPPVFHFFIRKNRRA
jgi:hypothetical protein